MRHLAVKKSPGSKLSCPAGSCQALQFYNKKRAFLDEPLAARCIVLLGAKVGVIQRRWWIFKILTGKIWERDIMLVTQGSRRWSYDSVSADRLSIGCLLETPPGAAGSKDCQRCEPTVRYRLIENRGASIRDHTLREDWLRRSRLPLRPSR